ncbi:MAG: trypsin-like peptidase domain-containing protein [Clostridia bacterium]|nr:trypsin-like peptidase domain-containing protein [Clostridia bacterium]
MGSTKRKKGSGAFGVVVIVLVVLLLASCVTGFFLLRKSGEAIFNSVSGFVSGNDGKQQSIKPAESGVTTPTPAPTAAPTESDREMPELDGAVPSIGSDSGNPIPTIFENVSPSVVGVVQYRTMDGILSVYGSGTGFIVSSKGYILTNAHVVEGAELVTVMLPDGEEIDAKVIGIDSDTDVGVLKVEHEGLKALAIGNSDDVRVGEFVLAIGNPLDMKRLANTLTFGIISAKSREITIEGQTNSYLQTDAAINYGNSGGPLLNMRGEVIGINSAKSITAGYDSFGNPISAEGIGFALPINTSVEIMRILIEKGTVERPAVGITVYTLTEAQAAKLNVEKGVYVESVVKDGPAFKAGVKAGDIIIKVNGSELADQSELVKVINSCKIGDSIDLVLLRNGEEISCTIQLGNKTEMNFKDAEKETLPDN